MSSRHMTCFCTDDLGAGGATNPTQIHESILQSQRCTPLEVNIPDREAFWSTCRRTQSTQPDRSRQCETTVSLSCEPRTHFVCVEVSRSLCRGAEPCEASAQSETWHLRDWLLPARGFIPLQRLRARRTVGERVSDIEAAAMHGVMKESAMSMTRRKKLSISLGVVGVA
jgi:hypothetical protein